MHCVKQSIWAIAFFAVIGIDNCAFVISFERHHRILNVGDFDSLTLPVRLNVLCANVLLVDIVART